jgi:cytochrome c-type biogenesis protein CcmI
MTSSSTVWIAALMLVASVALFVAAPLTEVFAYRRSETDDEARRARLEHDRGLATAALRELDFDHEMGKIADDEYHALRIGLETRALAAMSELSGLNDRGNPGSVGGKVCPRCAAPPAANFRFCPLCGAKLDRPADSSAT